MLYSTQQGKIAGSSIPNPESYKKTLNRIFDVLYKFNEVEIQGQENIPKDEPLLILANHRGSSDIPAVARAIQPVGLTRFVAKTEIIKIPYIGKKMINDWGAISLDRNAPSSKFILSCLETFNYEDDSNLGIFHEGTRKKDNIDTVGEVPSLIARIACYGNVSIVPVGIVGTEKKRNLVGFKNMYINVGESFKPEPIEATYDLAATTLEKLSSSDRIALKHTRNEIHENVQNALNGAILLSK